MRAAVLAALAAAGCLDTGAEAVQIPLRLAGASGGAVFAGRGGWQVELERAELAFGPLRLCAGQRASGACDVARAEWLDSAVVDVLSDAPDDVGELAGSGGVVRSAMYDLGIVSLLTQSDNVLLTAARELGGHSLELEGTARNADVALSFRAALALEQSAAVERGTPLIRAAFGPDAEHDLSLPGSALTVRFDARPWLANVDFQALSEAVCQPACPDVVEIVEGTLAHHALRTDVQTGARPSFEWSADAP